MYTNLVSEGTFSFICFKLSNCLKRGVFAAMATVGLPLIIDASEIIPPILISSSKEKDALKLFSINNFFIFFQ